MGGSYRVVRRKSSGIEWDRPLDFCDTSVLCYATRNNLVADYLAFVILSFSLFNGLVASELKLMIDCQRTNAAARLPRIRRPGHD